MPYIESQAIRAGQALALTDSKDSRTFGTDTQATASIRRYIIVEQKSVGAVVRSHNGDRWLETAATAGDILAMPEIGIEVPLAEFYLGLDVTEAN